MSHFASDMTLSFATIRDVALTVTLFQALFHYRYTYPPPGLRESPISAVCYAYTELNLFSPVHSHLLLPSALFL